MDRVCIIFGSILIAAFGIVLIAGDVSHIVPGIFIKGMKIRRNFKAP